MSLSKIDSFKGEYAFLSNFYQDEDGLSVEHSYQAMKARTLEEAIEILNAPTPAAAKKLGRTIPLREDWEDVKLIVMEVLLRDKFASPGLRDKLLATGDVELVEGNWWGDTFWGVCKGKGENHLGRLLMKIREELKT